MPKVRPHFTPRATATDYGGSQSPSTLSLPWQGEDEITLLCSNGLHLVERWHYELFARRMSNIVIG